MWIKVNLFVENISIHIFVAQINNNKWIVKHGELAEWLNAAVLKTVKDASPSGVRIPDSPQVLLKMRWLRF